MVSTGRRNHELDLVDDHIRHRTGDRRHRHPDPNRAVIDLDAVDKAKIDDRHANSGSTTAVSALTTLSLNSSGPAYENGHAASCDCPDTDGLALTVQRLLALARPDEECSPARPGCA